MSCHFGAELWIGHDKPKIPGHRGFPLANPHSVESLHVVPDENIGKISEKLCIWRGNLKYLDDEIVDANLKKRTPRLLPRWSQLLDMQVRWGQISN